MKAYDLIFFLDHYHYHRSYIIKLFFILLILIFAAKITIATNYYSNSSEPTMINNWWTNTNGTGSHPSNFTTSGDIFTLQSGQTCSTNNNNDWTIGTGVTLKVDGVLSISGNNSDVTINGTIIFTNSGSTQIILAGAGSGNSITINGTVKTANINGLQGTNCSMPVNSFKKTVSYGSFASFEFIALSNQATLGLPSLIYNLIVNCSTSVTINTSVSVTNIITLTNGILVIPTGLTVDLLSGNTIAGSGFGTTTHINTQVNTSTGAQGFFRAENITTTYTFPVGNGTYYLPATVSASGTSDFNISVFQGATTDGAPNGITFTITEKKTMVDAIWVLNRNAGSSSVTMQLSWPNALEGSTFTTYSDSKIGISHYSGGWDMTSGSGNQAANTATRNAISSFSPFMVGEAAIPLLLKFGNINGYTKYNGVQIDWASLNEVNVHSYIIERSKDRQQFIGIGQINSTGNIVSEKNYSWLDTDPLNGTSFYRIKAMEKDGGNKYSKIIMIIKKASETKEISLFPNPVQNAQVLMKAENIDEGDYRFIISDISGKPVYTKSFSHHGGSLNESIQLPAVINRGLYTLSLTGRNINVSKTFVVQ